MQVRSTRTHAHTLGLPLAPAGLGTMDKQGLGHGSAHGLGGTSRETLGPVTGGAVRGEQRRSLPLPPAPQPPHPGGPLGQGQKRVARGPERLDLTFLNP